MRVDPLYGMHITTVRVPISSSRYRQAKEAIARAISIETKHAKSYGGHRHQGAVSPLLQLPLPSGWRKP